MATLRRFECRVGTAKKFWECWTDRLVFTSRWGRIGKEPTQRSKTFVYPWLADEYMDEQIRKKLRGKIQKSTGLRESYKEVTVVKKTPKNATQTTPTITASTPYREGGNPIAQLFEQSEPDDNVEIVERFQMLEFDD